MPFLTPDLVDQLAQVHHGVVDDGPARGLRVISVHPAGGLHAHLAPSDARELRPGGGAPRTVPYSDAFTNRNEDAAPFLAPGESRTTRVSVRFSALR